MELDFQAMQGLGQSAVCNQWWGTGFSWHCSCCYWKGQYALFSSFCKITPLSVSYILIPSMSIRRGVKAAVYRYKGIIIHVKIELERLCISYYDATMCSSGSSFFPGYFCTTCGYPHRNLMYSSLWLNNINECDHIHRSHDLTFSTQI